MTRLAFQFAPAWRLRTPLANVRDTSVTGDDAWHRTAGALVRALEAS